MPPKPQATAPKKTGTILDRAKPMVWAKEEPFSIGLFGAPSSGKTTLWATFPKPILAVLCSGGLKSTTGKKAGELRSLSKQQREGISPIVLQNCEELNEVTDALRDGTSGYKTVVLDHLTSFSDLVLMQVLGLDSIPPQLNWGFAAQQDWGKHGALVKEFLLRMLELNMYSVIVSQQRWFDPKEGSDDIPRVGPACTPTVTGWLVPALDFCVQTFVRDQMDEKVTKVAGKDIKTNQKTGKIEFCAHLPISTTRMTKFRSPQGTKLPEVIVNPTFEKINNLVTGD